MSKPPSENRCEHTDYGGRRCRMIRSSTHPNLCHWHAVSEERKLLEARERAARTSPDFNVAYQLFGPVQDLRSAAAINHVLGRLVQLLAENSVSTRRAAVIAYSCNLLLHSLKELRYEHWYAKQYPIDAAHVTALLRHLPPLDFKVPATPTTVPSEHFSYPKPEGDRT